MVNGQTNAMTVACSGRGMMSIRTMTAQATAMVSEAPDRMVSHCGKLSSCTRRRPLRGWWSAAVAPLRERCPRKGLRDRDGLRGHSEQGTAT